MAKRHLLILQVGEKQAGNLGCIPLKRMYFSQYQFMPFYIASLAVFYYLPYVLFRLANSDLISLKGMVVYLSKVKLGNG